MGAKVLTVAIEKGGVAKTITATNLAALFAKDGYKVLMVDMDQQANSTMLMTGARKGDGVYKGRGIFDLFRAYGLADPSRFVVPTSVDGVDIIPSTNDTPQIASQLDILATSEEVSKNMLFTYALAGLADSYDYIIIDTPPSRDVLTTSALVASDYVLIPCKCDDFSIEGMENTFGLLRDLSIAEGVEIKLLGVVLTMAERNTLTKVIIENFEESDFKEDLFTTRIRKGQAVVDSIRLGGPVVLQSPNSGPSKDYMSLYAEVKERMAKMDREGESKDGEA